MDRADFCRHLCTGWAGAEAHPDPDREGVVIFAIPRDDERIDGYLEKDGQVLWIEKDLETSADMAAWFRSLVPEQQPLIFWDESYSHAVDVAPGAKADQIVRATLDAWKARVKSDSSGRTP